jgi:glutaryl-CoA dehydrogenase
MQLTADSPTTMERRTKTDQFEGHDYYNVDELFSEEHLIARDAVRTWVKAEVSPIIEDCFEKANYPVHLFKQLGEIGAYGPSLPVKVGTW